jgi:Na+-driven multidrug efflux pump
MEIHLMNSLTVGSPIRKILAFSLPLLLGNLFQQLYSLTDAAVVGRLIGVDALASIGATGSLNFLVIGFAWGATSGLAIPVSKAFGAGDFTEVRRAVARGAIIAVAIAAILSIAGTSLTGQFLRLLNTPPEIIDGSTIYLSIIFAGSAAIVGYNFLASTLYAVGDSRTPLIFLIASSVFNAVLVVVVVGVFGLGLASVAKIGRAHV